MAEKISAGELIVDVAADVSELKSGFAEVRNTLKKGNEKVGAFQQIWRGALRRVGEKATDFAFKAVKAPFSIALKSVVGLGKGMANLAKTSVLDAARFQTGLSEVATLGVEDMDGLRQGILGVSSAIGQDLATATKAAYQAISAGIPEGNVIDFLSVGAKAAVAGVTDMETAVDALSTAINAYGEDADQAMKFSDQFFQVIKLGKTTFPELAQAIGTVLPTAAALGVSFDEVGGALALMTQKGIATTEAVTALNALLLQLLSPAQESAAQIKAIVDSSGGFADLDLSKVIDQFSQLSTEIQVGVLGNVRSVKAVLALAGGEGEKAAGPSILDKIAADAVKASVALLDIKKSEEALATARGLERFSQGLEVLKASATALGVPIEGVAAALGTMVERGVATSTAVSALQKFFSQLATPAESVEESINAIVEKAGGLDKIKLDTAIEEFGKLDDKVKKDILGSIRDMDAALKLTDKEGGKALEDKFGDIEKAAKKAARESKAGMGDLEKTIASVAAAGGATETALQEFQENFELQLGIIKTRFSNFAIEVATPVAEAIGQVFAKINEQITPNLAPIATVIRDWFTDLWESGFDQQAVNQMSEGMGITIEEAIDALGGGANLKPSLKSSLTSLIDRMGEAIAESVRALEAGDTTLVDMFSAWMAMARERVGEEIDILFKTEFTKKLGEAWENNKNAILDTAEIIGTAIGKGIAKTAMIPVTGFLLWLENTISDVLVGSDAEYARSRARRQQDVRALESIVSPKGLSAPPVSPANIPSPASAIQQLSAPAMNQGSGGGGIGGGQPINITINQAAGEDSQSMVNRLREMLLDIQRFGNTRGLVAGQAHG